MTDPLTPPAPPPVPSESKGKNCWVIGCSGCLIGLVILVIGAFAIGAWLKSNFLTEPFDPVELSPREEAEVEAKLKSYNLLNDSGEVPEEFTFPEGGILLTEKEVNYFISQYGEDMADSIRLDFEPGEVTAELRVGEPEAADRWSFSARVSIEQMEEGLDIRLLDIKMGPFTVPSEMMDELGTENIAEEAFSDPEVREQFQQNVEKIEILKDQILFVPKSQ